MTVYDLKKGREIDMTDLPLSVALGNFDGLHSGHTKLIRETKCSEEKSCVFTFRENPFSPRIITLEEKLRMIGEMGVDYAAVFDFDGIRRMRWQDFLNDILIGKLHAAEVVCGFNFRFGYNAEGDSSKLREFMEQRGRRCTVVEPYIVDGLPVSSSRIRQALSTGAMEYAEKLLGRPYSIEYEVSHGNGIGSSLGFPTINHPYDQRDVKLPHGVYISSCMGHPAVTNFGVRPTVTRRNEEFYETYILDYNGDLYGDRVRVEFYSMIRPEMKFSSVRELTDRIATDVQITRDYFTSERK